MYCLIPNKNKLTDFIQTENLRKLLYVSDNLRKNAALC